MTLIGLVRHGQTDYNLRHLYQGSSDIPLNETGIDQAHHALDSIPEFPWDAIMSSSLARAEETARIIGRDHDIPFLGTLDGMCEVHFGWAEGRPLDEVRDTYPDRDYPDRESAEAALERAHADLLSVAERFPEGRILIVAHGTLIRYLLSAVARRPFPGPPNASLTLLHISPTRWSVPMVAGISVAEPWTWDHEPGEKPTIDPDWDAAGDDDLALLPTAETSALDAYLQE